MPKKNEKLNDLIKNIDDEPDKLHNDITPAVLELGRSGFEALPYLIEPLSSPDSMTRLHAQRALEYILLYHFGWVPGVENDPKISDSFKNLWNSNGGYQYDASEQKRKKSIDTWMAWYKKHFSNE